MKQSFKRYIQLCGLLLILSHTELAGQSSLIVRISGIRTPSGQVLYSLFKSPDGFPDQSAKAFRSGAVKVTSTEVEVNVSVLPPGEYALSVIHDVNGNNTLDVNRIGIPIEPVGFSNNVMGAFGPPKFQRARFAVRAGRNEHPLKLRMGQ